MVSAPPQSPADQGQTPMMAQFLEIKRKNEGSLLLYRMGDFYELFFDDAVKASATLGIALTKRGKHNGADIPMCGVPVHALDQYLQKLIRHGHRVAIAEQMEDPSEAKKRGSKSVVARDVIRLITPGTLTEDALLESGNNNYLACLTGNLASGELALSYAEISTGTFAVTLTSPARLAADLAGLSPSEILINDSLIQDTLIKQILEGQAAALTPIPVSRFDSSAATHGLISHYEVASLDGFGSFTRPELASLGALLDYIKLTQVGNMPHMREPRRDAPEAGLLIDAATRANLELTQTLSGTKAGSLLSSLDETVTSAGARLLANFVAKPLAEVAPIVARLDCISHFRDNENLTQNTRDHLRKIPDLERGLSRMTAGRGGPRDLKAIATAIQATKTLQILLHAEDSQALLPFHLASCLDDFNAAPHDIAQNIIDALDDELPYLARDGGYIKPGHSQELDSYRALRDDTRQVIAQLQSNYAETSGLKALKIKHNNVLGYFIEVTAQQAEVLIQSELAPLLMHRQTIASATRFATVELSDLEQKIAHAGARAIAIEVDLFNQLAREVVTQARAISQAALSLAAIDVFSSLAHIARNRNYVRPVVDDSLSFKITQGRHPVVEAALAKRQERKFAANDSDLSVAQNHLWLLTGPNMAGKSTYLRQNALIAIMAQVGSFVPASYAHIGIVDRLFSRVGAADDLARGRSTFMVEMIETAAILNQATPRSFVILDEIGRGTATYDGLSIAWATLEHLHDINKSRALFATHYHELTSLVTRLGNLHCATMKVKEWNGDLVFLHEVVPGAAERSYGIEAAKRAGLPASVIARATAVLKRLESSKPQNRPEALAADLPLFAVAPPPPAPTQNPALEKLESIAPDNLSPRDALDLLYELKSLSKAKP